MHRLAIAQLHTDITVTVMLNKLHQNVHKINFKDMNTVAFKWLNFLIYFINPTVKETITLKESKICVLLFLQTHCESEFQIINCIMLLLSIFKLYEIILTRKVMSKSTFRIDLTIFRKMWFPIKLQTNKNLTKRKK